MFDRRPSLRRIVAAVGGSLILLGLVACYGLSETAATVAPRVALRFNPLQSEALGKVAFSRLQAGDTDVTSIAAMARRAITINPTAVAAVRTLAYVAAMQNDPHRAGRLITQSQALSRRDAATQIWLIEQQVAQGDVAGALTHYDIALKTSVSNRTLLIPILVKATADGNLLGPLARLLVPRPVWRPEFLASLLENAPNSANAAKLAYMLKQGGTPLEPDERIKLSNKLITDQQYSLASRLMGRDHYNDLIFNGDFGKNDDASPFNWRLRNDSDLGASIDPQGRPSALHGYASQERGGDIAQQLLTLAPGRYRLTTSIVRGVSAGKQAPFWTLACADGAQIAAVDITTPPENGDTSAVVSVPDGCKAQWLVLHMRPPASGEDAELVLRGVAFKPLA